MPSNRLCSDYLFSDYLFVYGTLRPALRHPMQRDMDRYGDWLGPAHWRGRLYDLGHYPGAVAGGYPPTLVQGDLFMIRQTRALFPLLDRYEDSRRAQGEYRRVQSEVIWNRQSQTAWLYVYRRPVAGKKLIISGDYLVHRGVGSSPDRLRR